MARDDGVEAGGDHDPLALPAELLAITESHPWESIADAARAVLRVRVPELTPSIDTLDARVFGLDSGFFVLPAALARTWGATDEGWIDDLLVLLALGHGHYVVQDAVIDAGRCPPELCLLSDVFLLAYLDSLAAHSPASDPGRYRVLHDRYYRWYALALTTELVHRLTLMPYTAEEIKLLGLKAAPGNTVVHLVADATGRQGSVVEDAVRAVMQLCTGLQLLDDLADLAVDHGDGNYTMPLTATLLALPEEDRSAVHPDDLTVHAATTGVTAACIDIARSYFTLAAASAARADAPVLEALASTWHRRADARRRVVDRALAET